MDAAFVIKDGNRGINISDVERCFEETGYTEAYPMEIFAPVIEQTAYGIITASAAAQIESASLGDNSDFANFVASILEEKAPDMRDEMFDFCGITFKIMY